MWSSPLGLVQAAASLQGPVERIAVSQIVMAVGITIWTLVLLAIGITTFLLYRSVRRLVSTVEGQVKQLAPKAEPLLTAANRIAGDATDISGSVRSKVHELLETVDELNHRVRELTADAEERVRQLGVVLDVVQGEAEELLVDAAATARGLHTTAEALQRPRRSGGRLERRG